MSREIERYDALAIRNTIVEDYLLKGVDNATKIAKELGIKRAEVLDHIDAWKEFAQNDEGVKARSRELLTEMDKAYNKIIAELWNAHASADSAKDMAAILKTIAEVIAKRQDTLQKAGLYDDALIGDELAEVEEQMDAIKNLLKQVATNHPAARQEIMHGLGVIFKQTQSIPVEGAATGPVA